MERPRGIPALEDQLVPLACAKLLTAIYAQELLDGRYGYRPGRGALDAVRDLTFDLQYGTYGYVVEVDSKGFFDHLDHAWLVDMLRVRMDDRAFLRLIRKWLKAGILEPDGQVLHPETGTPQGGTVTLLTKLRTHCESSRPVFHVHSSVPAMAKDFSARRSSSARVVPLQSLWDKETSVVRRERHPPQRREMQRTFAPSRLRLSWLAPADEQGVPMSRRTPSRSVCHHGEDAEELRRRSPQGHSPCRGASHYQG
jgi:hypothetical protein